MSLFNASSSLLLIDCSFASNKREFTIGCWEIEEKFPTKAEKRFPPKSALLGDWGEIPF